jgi:hypothetical protein
MSNKNKENLDLDLTDDQQRVAEALVFSGVNFERERLTNILSPHIGKAVNVDTMINIINNLPIVEQEEEESETE